MITARCALATVVAACAGAMLATAAPAATPPQIRIIGGTNASDTQFPYQARLTIRQGTSVYLCGAAIRDATHVMTAAHCVVDAGHVAAATDVTVSYGAAARSQQRVVTAYEVRPAAQYVAGDKSWDAALITLSSPLVGYGGSTVNGIPLIGASESALATSSGASATVSGWGRTEQGTLPETLRGTQLTLRRDDACTSTYGSSTFVSSRFVCAGGTGSASSGNPDSCSGDSGGPLVTTTASGLRLIGLVSFGPSSGCGRPGIPAAYTEVSDSGIAALLSGTTPEAPAASAPAPNSGAAGSAQSQAGGGPQGTAIATTVPARPIASPAAARPTARVVGIRCVRHRCAIRVNGEGASLTARIGRRERRCVTRRNARVCRSSWKPITTLWPRRTGNGYTMVLRLSPGSYRISAVASDGSGGRSPAARRGFRVAR